MEEVIGNFVDQYCMCESEIDEFLRKQANEQQQSDDPQQPNHQHTQQELKSPLPPGLVTLTSHLKLISNVLHFEFIYYC